jgi:hypothetical protein
MNAFNNFKLLKKDMEGNGWIIEAFSFNYKDCDYIILVKLYQKNEKKPKYALLRTEIIKADNIDKSITFPVNSSGFMTDPQTLREFFNIDYSKNLRDILVQFNNYFSNFIPIKVNAKKSDILKNSMISSLSKSDSENPDKKYCYTVRRNSVNGNRSPFNDNKTKLLRPELYLKFKDEPTISFCYSKESTDEKNNTEILLKFSERK